LTKRLHFAQEVAAGDAIGKQKLLSGHERSIRIHKLSKSFETVSAVKELSLTMERNRVFCVLGHSECPLYLLMPQPACLCSSSSFPLCLTAGLLRVADGAGKTTLLNTLTGLHNPTFGEAFVCGHSIRTEMPAIQRLMGICPQHDVLWEDLTAKQVLQFYARFKGIPGSRLAKYIDDAIDQFGLHAEANKRVGTFSGAGNACLFAPFCSQNNIFTKTGSGQT